MPKNRAQILECFNACMLINWTTTGLGVVCLLQNTEVTCKV